MFSANTLFTSQLRYALIPKETALPLDIFAPKAPPVLGVDISASAIKMVELSVDKKGMRLERYAVEPISEPLLTDGSVMNSDGLAAAIQACHNKLGSKIKGVATALPASMVITKVIRLARGLSDLEIEDQVAQDMSNTLPFSIDEANLDFQAGDDGVEDDVPVFASAALRVRVEERVNAIEQAGLKAIIVDSEQLALIDAVEKYMDRNGLEGLDRNILIVDIGSSVTQFYILRNGEVIYSRESNFGGSQLTSDIQDRLGVSIDDARRIKMGAKESDNPELVRTLQDAFADAAAQEARRQIQLFTTSSHHAAVDTVFLSGGSVAIPGLSERVEEALSVTSRLLNPFEGMTIASNIDQDRLARESASLVIACGLAMRRFDK